MAIQTLTVVVRWLVAVPAGLLFALCVVGNWSTLVGLAFRRSGSTSLILPFFGPILGLVCLLTIPIREARRYWWVAPLVEPTWLLVAWFFVSGVVARFARNRES